MKIKKVWITRPELDDILSGWTPSTIIDIGDIGGLIPGSIPFADASGFLTEDNTALFWDATNEILKITSATALLIDLYPGFTGSGFVMNITPSAALDTVDAIWEGIYMDCDALDPSAIGVEVHGVHIDLSGVDKTNDPHTDCLHLLSPSFLAGDHALHCDGEIHIGIDATSGVTGEEYTAIDVVIATTGSTGGDLHVLDVARSGVGAIAMAAVATHEGIDVIHQAIGTFANADKIWEYDNDGPGWTDVTAGVVNIWDDKDDLIYVGHANTFSEIKFIFSAVATKDMHFKFYFSAGGAAWTRFFPADDTNGATQNGSVRYTAASLPTWATDTVNGTANKYWIQIERTRTSGTGPTATSMQQLAPTLYGWDKLGAITALSLSAGQVTDTGVTATNVAAGTVGERPGGVVGDIRYNSTLGVFEIYTGAWKNIVATGDNVVFGTIGCDTITVTDGSSINLQEDITFTGATTENLIKFPDNLPDAFSFMEGVNPYQTFITSNGSEAIQFHEDVLLKGSTEYGVGNKTTGAWAKSIGGGGDYADWATMIVAMPDMIAHAVTVTIEAGTTLTEICELKNKHSLTKDGRITIQAEKYFPTSGAIPTADSATATTLRDGALAAAALGNDYFNGCWVFIVHGTGTDNGFVLITDYIDATGDVVVAGWPGTQPNNTSRYIIVGALIDCGGIRDYGLDILNCTASVFLNGIGVDDADLQGILLASNFLIFMKYCGVHGSDRHGINSAYSLYTRIDSCGIVKNNTDNLAGVPGVFIGNQLSAIIRDSGISDNNRYGITIEGGSFAVVRNNFGDGNGVWGTYALYSGQARFVGTECSGSGGNHSDTGTAGANSQDQAAAY